MVLDLHRNRWMSSVIMGLKRVHSNTQKCDKKIMQYSNSPARFSRHDLGNYGRMEPIYPEQLCNMGGHIIKVYMWRYFQWSKFELITMHEQICYGHSYIKVFINHYHMNGNIHVYMYYCRHFILHILLFISNCHMRYIALFSNVLKKYAFTNCM